MLVCVSGKVQLYRLSQFLHVHWHQHITYDFHEGDFSSILMLHSHALNMMQTAVCAGVDDEVMDG